MRKNYHRQLWGEIITGNYEEKLTQEIMRRNYHRKLWGEIITENYEEKLSQKIMRRNYHRKLWGEIITGNYEEELSASIYHHAKNVGIIGILAYQQIKSKHRRGYRRVPLPFRGKRAENCSYNVGKSLGEGLAHKFWTDDLLWPSMTFKVILIKWNICVFITLVFI